MPSACGSCILARIQFLTYRLIIAADLVVVLTCCEVRQHVDPHPAPLAPEGEGRRKGDGRVHKWRVGEVAACGVQGASKQALRALVSNIRGCSNVSS